MRNELFQVGDKVTITIPAENREWGYNPCPDGTVATIISFSEMAWGRTYNCGMRPGIHLNRAWANLRLEDGQEILENTGRLTLLALPEEIEQRSQAFYSVPEDHNAGFLRELPETPFWEGDLVRVDFQGALRDLVVQRIDYDCLDRLCNNGSPYPCYALSDESHGWSVGYPINKMTLVERGKVWRYYHYEHLTFRNLREEFNFFASLGHTSEVQNPATGFYKWTKEEVLQAIREGLVHGFRMDGLFGEPSISALWFRDEELGKRVAAETLKGFLGE